MLVLRQQIRSCGFLRGFDQASLPFYSSDLKVELHKDLHNFKLTGEEVRRASKTSIHSLVFHQNFRLSLDELRSGKNYTELSVPVVPKTDEESEKAKRKGEKSKEVLFSDLKQTVEEALKTFASDHYLSDLKLSLETKSHKSFNPKDKLVQLVSEVEEHVDNLMFKNSGDIDQDESDDEDI